MYQYPGAVASPYGAQAAPAGYASMGRQQPGQAVYAAAPGQRRVSVTQPQYAAAPAAPGQRRVSVTQSMGAQPGVQMMGAQPGIRYAQPGVQAGAPVQYGGGQRVSIGRIDPSQLQSLQAQGGYRPAQAAGFQSMPNVRQAAPVYQQAQGGFQSMPARPVQAAAPPPAAKPQGPKIPAGPDPMQFAADYSMAEFNPPRSELRPQIKILILGPGYGLKQNPVQGEVITKAGYQIQYEFNLGNPEDPEYKKQNLMEQYLPNVKKAIDEFQPHIVMAASKGGGYVPELWKRGWWTGPTVLINAHPTCLEFPKDARTIVTQGSNDAIYPTERSRCDALALTGTSNANIVYYTCDSAALPNGAKVRFGDEHNQFSLLSNDGWPRFIDALMAEEAPEMHLHRTWSAFLSQSRLQCEAFLGYSTADLKRFWQSQDQAGKDEQKVFEVAPDSDEFQAVSQIFRAKPLMPPEYNPENYAQWEGLQVRRVQRLEHGDLEEQWCQPYLQGVAGSIEAQGLAYEPGLHSRWVFHGSSAVEQLQTDPGPGFAVQDCSYRANLLWGKGQYFARDAKYCGTHYAHATPEGNGLLVLGLLTTGMCCQANPETTGPAMRQPGQPYNTIVDSVSTPELFITQDPGSIYPAYIIEYGK